MHGNCLLSVPRCEQFSESSKKTVSFEEQIISKDKYTSMFQHKVEDTVCCIVHIFFNALKKMFTNILLFPAWYGVL